MTATEVLEKSPGGQRLVAYSNEQITLLRLCRYCMQAAMPLSIATVISL